jgi:NAD(P)-dependent dehydrogenase (short-subunit alcohol dehydrogenase family)
MTAFSYDGKRVVVTGAASGMGAATVAMLADTGAEVHGLDIAHVDGPAARAYEIDLGDPASIDRTVDAITKQVDGRVDAVFNVAGVPQTHTPLRVMQVNFLGLRHFTECILPFVPDGGAIASVASLAGMGWQEHVEPINELLATPDFDAGTAWCETNLEGLGDPYFFSKECLILYTFTRSHQTVQRGVRMNCISPGPVDSPMMPAFRSVLDSALLDWTASQANGRMGRPEEMAPPLVFLNSDEASYVNGHNLLVDAGFTAAMTTGQVDFSTLPG